MTTAATVTSNIGNYLANQGTATSTIASSTTGSSTSSDLAAGASDLSTSYQTFLTLLTTQLKNQDPSAPMDPNQFTTELVQMTGVQQQLLSNQLLQQLVNASPSTGVSSAVNLIGKQVSAVSATSSLANGQASWTYSLPQAASNATVSISNATGQVVYTGVAPSFSAGPNAFTWNGQSNAGVEQPNGVYTLSIAATDSNGSPITPTLGVSGTATAVSNVGGTTMVTVGGSPVPLSSITSVSGS